jgi:hypothetical protein
MPKQAVPELYWHGEQLQNCSHSAKTALPVSPPLVFIRRAQPGSMASSPPAMHAAYAGGASASGAQKVASPTAWLATFCPRAAANATFLHQLHWALVCHVSASVSMPKLFPSGSTFRLESSSSAALEPGGLIVSETLTVSDMPLPFPVTVRL